jgi:hypothetical protein
MKAFKVNPAIQLKYRSNILGRLTAECLIDSQDCQMAYFQTKNPNLGKFLRDLQWKFLWPFGLFHGHVVYFLAIWYIWWPFGILCGHFVYFMVI